MGLLGKFEHVVVYDKGRHFYLLSPQISFKCVSVFPHSAVSVKKTMSMSSLIKRGQGIGAFPEFQRVFKCVCSYVRGTILKYAFLYLPFKHYWLRLQRLKVWGFFVCLWVCFSLLFLNILHSVPVGELLAIRSINSSTLPMGTGSLFKLLHACKCQPGYSATDCWPSCG